jgi:hypothetical protein
MVALGHERRRPGEWVRLVDAGAHVRHRIRRRPPAIGTIVRVVDEDEEIAEREESGGAALRLTASSSRSPTRAPASGHKISSGSAASRIAAGAPCTALRQYLTMGRGRPLVASSMMPAELAITSCSVAIGSGRQARSPRRQRSTRVPSNVSPKSQT